MSDVQLNGRSAICFVRATHFAGLAVKAVVIELTKASVAACQWQLRSHGVGLSREHRMVSPL